MTGFEKDEFWNALGRLYDSSVKLQVATEKLAEIATSHEKRLDRVEVLLEAVQEDLNWLKRNRPPTRPF